MVFLFWSDFTLISFQDIITKWKALLTASLFTSLRSTPTVSCRREDNAKMISVSPKQLDLSNTKILVLTCFLTHLPLKHTFYIFSHRKFYSIRTNLILLHMEMIRTIIFGFLKYDLGTNIQAALICWFGFYAQQDGKWGYLQLAPLGAVLMAPPHHGGTHCSQEHV